MKHYKEYNKEYYKERGHSEKNYKEYYNPTYFPRAITNSQNQRKWRVITQQVLKTTDCEFELIDDNIHILSDLLFEEIIFKIVPTDEERVKFADMSVLTQYIRGRFLFIEKEQEEGDVERWHFTNNISIIVKMDNIERDYLFEITSNNDSNLMKIKLMEIIYTKNGSCKFHYETKTNNIDGFIDIFVDNNLISIHRDSDYYVRFDYNNQIILFNRVI